MLLNSPYKHVTRNYGAMIILMHNYTWEPWEIPREVPQNVDLTSATIYYNLDYNLTPEIRY